MFNHKEALDYDFWKTREPYEPYINNEHEIVDESVVSQKPIYLGDKVIFDEDGYMAKPEELDDFIDKKVNDCEKLELIDILECFAGIGIVRDALKRYIIRYVEIYSQQGRKEEVMEIFGLTEGRAE